MKWKSNKQDQTVSLTNLTVIRGEDNTPICYVGDRQHEELIKSAPELLDCLKDVLTAFPNLEEWENYRGDNLKPLANEIRRLVRL